MKRTKIGAIDVGTTKVCTVMADTDGTNLRVLGVGVNPSQGLQKGLVVNLKEAKESIRESVKTAEKTAGYRMESACVGITGRHIQSGNTKGVIAITRSDRMVHPADLKRVLEVAKSIKVPSDHKLLHIIPLTYVVDGQEGVKNPVGMHGLRLDVETHIITAAITSIQNLTKCVRGIGIEIDDLILESLASAEAVLSEEERQDGVMLADIGGGTTDIAVFKDSSIYHTSVLPVAGYQITRDISVGLGLSFELAEEMKKKYGNVMPSEEKGNSDKTLTEDGHSISYLDLSEIIRVRVEELLRLIMLELPGADYTKLIPSGLVLTGGSANLPGITELGSQITRFPVRVGTAPELFGVADNLRDPAYSTAVGLLLWKIKNQNTKTLQPYKSRGAFMGFVSRLFQLFQPKPGT
jgi:cell division protein FtsA